jgi:hypothetical protein
MGQAKQRGSFETRKQEAQTRIKEHLERLQKEADSKSDMEYNARSKLYPRRLFPAVFAMMAAMGGDYRPRRTI